MVAREELDAAIARVREAFEAFERGRKRPDFTESQVRFLGHQLEEFLAQYIRRLDEWEAADDRRLRERARNVHAPDADDGDTGKGKRS
jgi:hypothetical protein